MSSGVDVVKVARETISCLDRWPNSTCPLSREEERAMARVVIAAARVSELHRLHIELLEREDDTDAMLTYNDLVEAHDALVAALRGGGE